MTIKFQKYYVTNGLIKAPVHYSLDNRHDGRKCVTIFAKSYSKELGAIFANEFVDDTDSMTDYFDKGRVNLFEDHPLYAAARARAEEMLHPGAKPCDNEKIKAFAAAVEISELEGLKLHQVDCESNREGVKTSIKPGKKYTRVDVGTSGRYMIDEAGNIFGIKAYGVPHFGKRYGTLDNPIITLRY